MAQHNDVSAPVRRYTRIDFTALRFKLNRVSNDTIFDLYHEDDLTDRGINSPTLLMAWLDELRDQLIERARLANPLIAKMLEDARRGGVWSKRVVDFMLSVGEQDQSRPKPADSLSVWLKPVASKALAADGLNTVADLMQCIELRGPGWYRPIPRLGAGKAKALERWLGSHATVLGALNLHDELPSTDLVELGSGAELLVPLERVSHVSSFLDGSQGVNRNWAYCLISAKNDLEAIQAYLYKFRGKDKTLRAYQRELERFLLWCVLIRRIPLSSVLTEECEAYKDFLANPDASWRGTKVPRKSARWRPFETDGLAPQSQRYAVQVLRSFFEWLARLRYLGGNPWLTVADPDVTQKIYEIAIDKAIPEDLWALVVDTDGLLDRACTRYAARAPGSVGCLMAKDKETPGAQYRLARAAILLLGTSGLRREEAAHATRDKLKPVVEEAGRQLGLWELEVLGKRKKLRMVMTTPRAIEALKAHWADRGHDFDYPLHNLALLSPVVVPNTPRAKVKHLNASADLTGVGFSPDGLYQVVKSALLRLADDETVELTEHERAVLKQAAPHALRHTFATHAAGSMELDSLRRMLGHTSLQTTSIYVQAERASVIRGYAAYAKPTKS